MDWRRRRAGLAFDHLGAHLLVDAVDDLRLARREGRGSAAGWDSERTAACADRCLGHRQQVEATVYTGEFRARSEKNPAFKLLNSKTRQYSADGHLARAQQPYLPLPPAASSPTKSHAGTATRLHRQPSCSQPAGRPAAAVPTGSQSEDYSWPWARSVCEQDNRSRRNHRRRDAAACRTYARQRGVVHVRALPCKPRVGKHAPQARHGSDGHGGGGTPGALPAVRLRCALLQRAVPSR